MTDYLWAKRITIPEFDIVSSPTFNISEIRRRRFNILNRYQSISPKNPWVQIYGDILKHGYKVVILSVDKDGTYHIDVEGWRYKLEPGKQAVEEE
jgi:hypothetical protein